MVLARVATMKKNGVEAMNFGKTHKTDFFIPPFALFYFYIVLAAAFIGPRSVPGFSLPRPSRGSAFTLCLAGLLLLLWSLVSFGQSFRVGIDADHPDALIVTGVFAFSRNPIYVAFGSILLGQFLIFSNWILLVYVGAGIWLFRIRSCARKRF